MNSERTITTLSALKKYFKTIVKINTFLILVICNHASAVVLTDTSQDVCYSGNGVIDLDLNETACWVVFPGTRGQDGHYTTGIKPSYENNQNGTVTDENNGLTWQQTPDCIGRNWSAANEFCENLEFADHDDWRLPSRHELTSILDFGRWRPVLNTDYFNYCIPPPDTGFSHYWTSTRIINIGIHSVEFYNGGPLGNAEALQHFSANLNVRCVRGEPLPVVGQLLDNQDGTITDTTTELMWEKVGQPITTQWDGNLQYCENLEFAGHKDWRLPNIKELESLVDDTKYNPSGSSLFSENYGELPSSTTIAIDPSHNLLPALYSLSVIDGVIQHSPKRNGLAARCVRLGPPSDFWSRQEIDSEEALLALHFINSKTGWLVGNEKKVIKTTDGGTTWTTLHHEEGLHSFLALDFADPDNGWAISNIYTMGGRGFVFNTDDGGVSWHEQFPEATGYHEDIFFIDTQTGWVIGSNRIHKTDDGGVTWDDQSPGLSGGNYKNIFFLNAETGWVAGKIIVKTEDGGATWVKQYEYPTGTLRSIFFTDENNGWAVGDTGLILRTVNGGQTWEIQNSGTDIMLRLVEFSDNSNGFIFGILGTFLHTTNGGATWKSEYSGSAESINSLQFVQGTTGYALIEGGALLKTKPGILPVAKGDLNNDGDIDLYDLILGLQVVCGIDTSVTSEADSNNDHKIGIEEVIFIFQKLSGLN